MVKKFATEPPDGLAPEIMYPQLDKGEMWCATYEKELLEKLRTGELSATGLMNGRGTRRSVPVIEWQDLHFRDMRGSRAEVIDRQQWGANMWKKLSFPAENVRQIWEISKSSAKFSAEDKAVRWLHELFVNDDKLLTTRLEVEKLAKKKFGVTGRGFDRALAAAKKSSGNSNWPPLGRPRGKKVSH